MKCAWVPDPSPGDPLFGEIDTYLAHDPEVWRIVSVTKAGDVLCDILGAETIGRINASVAANLCVRCGAAKPIDSDIERALWALKTRPTA